MPPNSARAIDLTALSTDCESPRSKLHHNSGRNPFIIFVPEPSAFVELVIGLLALAVMLLWRRFAQRVRCETFHLPPSPDSDLRMEPRSSGCADRRGCPAPTWTREKFLQIPGERRQGRRSSVCVTGGNPCVLGPHNSLPMLQIAKKDALPSHLGYCFSPKLKAQ